MVPFPRVPFEIVVAIGLIGIAIAEMARLKPGPPLQHAINDGGPGFSRPPPGFSRAIVSTASGALSMLYLGLPLGALVAVHQIGGRGAVLLLVATVALSDTAQYYSGRTFGRRPLAPQLSPKKTIEGAIGGFVAAPIFLFFAGPLLVPTTRPILLAAVGVAVVIAGIAGDLFESMLKRAADVKDSSALIPGHGGVLDRIDALLFATPVFYLYLRWARDRVTRIAILGSTGSIGTSALAVADAHPDRVEVVGLAAGGNAQLFASQVQRYRPRAVAMASGSAMDALRAALNGSLPACHGTGSDGLVAVATHPDVDVVLCASSGTAALEAMLAAIEAGKTIGLANKEVLVMAGGLVMDAAARRGVAILPVDSEHNAIHQCLHARQPARAPAADSHRVGWTVPRPIRGEPGGCHGGRGAETSHLADGTEDHDRLGDADEQGPRSDRGALAVRRAPPRRFQWSCTRNRSCTRLSS